MRRNGIKKKKNFVVRGKTIIAKNMGRWMSCGNIIMGHIVAMEILQIGRRFNDSRGREDLRFCEDGAIIVVVKSTLRSIELERGVIIGIRHGNTRS